MVRNSKLGSSSVNISDTAVSLQGYEQDQDVEEEESGWTAYFDDYFSNKTLLPAADSEHTYDSYIVDEVGFHGGSGSMLCSLHSPSMVSDVASCAAWKSQYKNSDGNSTRAETLAARSSFDATQMVIHRKLIRFKTTNRHNKSGYYYDDSLEDTASSPVNSPKAKGDYRYDHQQGQDDELKQQVVEVNKSLKKKGLCLVPYSMLVNYTG